MKYRYRLIIENTTENQEILEMAGHGISKTQQTCLKSVRRNINETIRKMPAAAEALAAGPPLLRFSVVLHGDLLKENQDRYFVIQEPHG